jgi:general stress protein 26
MKHELETHYESVSGSVAVEKIRALAKSARYCLFGTDLSHPPVTVRPMTVQSVDDSGSLWFLSGRTTHLNQQIEADSQVQLFFANPSSSEFLTIDGHATISDDLELRKAHWTPIAKTWFNGGVDDPDLTVIRVAPRDGYYWDTKHGKTVATLKIVVGAVTGKTIDDSVEGSVRL